MFKINKGFNYKIINSEIVAVVNYQRMSKVHFQLGPTKVLTPVYIDETVNVYFMRLFDY